MFNAPDACTARNARTMHAEEHVENRFDRGRIVVLCAENGGKSWSVGGLLVVKRHQNF